MRDLSTFFELKKKESGQFCVVCSTKKLGFTRKNIELGWGRHKKKLTRPNPCFFVCDDLVFHLFFTYGGGIRKNKTQKKYRTQPVYFVAITRKMGGRDHI
eukprot:GEMP01124007.1.p1 GENE.GEMP01124007.1~~GEMP01124007.1.p1  ORF type:complete len:100 (+),score=6.80 GEMP01124007.1:126-425(+)